MGPGLALLPKPGVNVLEAAWLLSTTKRVTLHDSYRACPTATQHLLPGDLLQKPRSAAAGACPDLPPLSLRASVACKGRQRLSVLPPCSVHRAASQLTHSRARGTLPRFCQRRSGCGGTACTTLCLRHGPHAYPLRSRTSRAGLYWLWAFVQVGSLRLVSVPQPAGCAAHDRATEWTTSLRAHVG